MTFILFISFVAYAFGAVAGKRLRSSRSGATVALHPLETLLVVCLLVSIALWHPRHSITQVSLLALAMMTIGAAVSRATLVKARRATAGTREFEEANAEDPQRGLWKHSLDFSRAVVDYEFRLFLVLIYLLVVGPFALMIRAFKSKPAAATDSSNWIPRRNEAPSLDAAHRPF